MLKLDAFQRKCLRLVRDGAQINQTVMFALREIEQAMPGSLKFGKNDVALTDAGLAMLEGRTLSTIVKKPNRRQAKFKARLLKNGGRRTSLNFSPETNGFIQAIQKHRPEHTVTQIVAEAVAILALKLHKASKEQA